jgi:hypothetical protein
MFQRDSKQSGEAKIGSGQEAKNGAKRHVTLHEWQHVAWQLNMPSLEAARVASRTQGGAGRRVVCHSLLGQGPCHRPSQARSCNRRRKSAY